MAVGDKDSLAGGEVIAFYWTMSGLAPCPEWSWRKSLNGLTLEVEGMGGWICSRPGGEVGW